ncbi:acyl carrier protein [Streptomyces mutabilis]|uniref:Acyl carrier protein n=1 Tax=Streptomyces mutabilis TaxID=67332 RepID=A0A086N0F9_9ACTN|nr:acyl carrier protein [Streptomyces mutabilis]KFG74627.1 acyl carrier protein [Streptomyces mutabilis]
MSQDQIFQTLKEVFVDVVPEVEIDRITLQDSMRDLGANSIDRAEIITETMEQLDIALPMVSFAEARNIGDIVAVLAGEGA